MTNTNYKPRGIDHRHIARGTETLNSLLAEAVDELQEADRRERLLASGDEANRDDMLTIYPALGGRR